MSSCPHIGEFASQIAPPRSNQQVHKEECTLCFDGQDSPEGVLVCLQCFNGGCLNPSRAHARLHYARTSHPLGLNIKRHRKAAAKRRDSTTEEPPMKKLAIVVPSDEELWEFELSLRCFKCDEVHGAIVTSDDVKIEETVDGIMKSMASAQQSEVKAWEEELEMCEHTLMLQQENASNEISPHCSQCDLTSNLWLCLTCGTVNCGRQQFGGIGGNGHALQHFSATGHGVGVKLGTITPEGGGDVYCYTCDDSRIDPDLPRHLEHFGMSVVDMRKTDKSMTELQIEHNLKFDFSMTGDDGKELEPVFGPGLTGLKNLGNSCYMASVLQSIFALPAFQERYPPSRAQEHFEICTSSQPSDCLECQMFKISDGLLSGRYSHPAQAHPPPSSSTETPFQTEENKPKFQEGVRPAMFKALVGKGHEEFSTMRQQDSEEFLQHLIKCLRQDAKRRGFNQTEEATETFRFGMEQRLQCGECKGVSYRTDQTDSISLPVPAKEKGELIIGEGDGGSAMPKQKQYEPVAFDTCLDMLVEPEALEYSCPQCQKKVIAEKQQKFKTFPQTLVVHMKKFQLVNWMPTKLDIPVTVNDDLNMDRYLSVGKQDGEVELGETSQDSALPEFDVAALSQLEAMGFPLIRCQKALLATGNSDAEAAMNWLFQHMEDPDIDAPLQSTAGAAVSSGSAGPEPSAEQVSMLADMGFTHAQAKKALRETDGNAERAVEWLFSHPDDMGEDSIPQDAETVAPQSVGGSADLPANYRLKAFISHKGPSVHSGHYVATIRQNNGSWILFNDEKVVKAEGEGNDMMKSLAYLYIYQRV
ncbi:hypothetical protein NliqN6_4028 [Naganishia liquefaciens]|uniref:Ubiquitin carboxyl-terminal hydrolase n=1 Tax=Naganishia liquefaciens TaxID=104408 RepID=A0A8H3YHG8_9TREE|nr:hypothetical protein NliqN6_4028 [Naganishia liquefaciens]